MVEAGYFSVLSLSPPHAQARRCQTNPTKNRGWTQVLWKSKQFQHMFLTYTSLFVFVMYWRWLFVFHILFRLWIVLSVLLFTASDYPFRIPKLSNCLKGENKRRKEWIIYFRFMCMFCRSLFVLLSLFFWPLCCVFFFELRILITHLTSSNSSWKYNIEHWVKIIFPCFL
jgi:hypothetical protein